MGALLSSGSLVGLAERQPLGAQRDVVLGTAEVVDRLAHFLSLNRPADALASALDGEEKVYDVDALIAGARTTTSTVADEPPEPDDAAGATEPSGEPEPHGPDEPRRSCRTAGPGGTAHPSSLRRLVTPPRALTPTERSR